MVRQRPQPFPHAFLCMDITEEDKSEEEEKEGPNDGPFDYVGGLLRRTHICQSLCPTNNETFCLESAKVGKRRIFPQRETYGAVPEVLVMSVI